LAFKQDNEAILVNKLRETSIILSLVAVKIASDKVIDHIMFSELFINSLNKNKNLYSSSSTNGSPPDYHMLG
jgi:predicted N-acetyltransferase YhbS